MIDVNLLRAHNRSTNSDVVNYQGSEDCKGILDDEHLGIMYPIDATTGLINSDLAKISNPLLSNAERATIMDRLQQLHGNFLPNGLSDSEIYGLIPPRYFSDAVDVQAWRDYIGKEIIPNMSDKVVRAIGEEVNDVSEVSKPANDEPIYEESMKFVLDLLKLLLVILPLIGKMLHTNYKRKHIDEKDVTEEDNALFEQ